MGVLTNEQFEQLQAALFDAYTYESLERMLRLRLTTFDGRPMRLDAIVKQTGFEHQVFQVIETAEREGWTYKLLLAARGYNPGNPQLLAVANLFGLAATNTPTRSTLEGIVRKNNKFLDPDTFRTRQGWVETSVCRIRIDGASVGTGFLVGPSLVMTNYHVVEQVIDSKASPPITCQFDYKRLNNGQELSKGVEYGVAAADWLVAKTPSSPEEALDKAKTALPTGDELDFALLRLNESIGTLELGPETAAAAGTSAAIPRAWLAFNTDYVFAPDTPLLIMQHPLAKPLQMAMDTDAVIGANENGTRVAYRTNTEPGSSGSPVFDQNWNLVALHHMGDPSWNNPTQNEGVPVKSIKAYLQKEGLAGVLGKQAL